MRYMEATAQSLHAPQDYVRSVLPAPPSPEPAKRAADEALAALSAADGVACWPCGCC